MLRNNNSSFTLIELLVVLALVAILSVVVVMTLNPAELLKQARDSNRLSDLATINTALNLFSTDVLGGFMGTSTVVYVSIPDTTSTCANLGLPDLATGYTYNCVISQNLRNTDGSGWIPVNFQRISSNSPISQLPLDPVNTTTTGNYYTYVTGGSWMLSVIPESQKQKAELSTNPNLPKYPGVIAMGNNLDISPLYNSNGLVGYWKFDEGSGIVAKDSSGYGNDGVLISSPSWVSGKILNGLSFPGIAKVSVPTLKESTPRVFSASFWAKQLGYSWQFFMSTEHWYTGKGWLIGSEGGNSWGLYRAGSGSQVTSYDMWGDGGWHHVVATHDGTSVYLYGDGILLAGGTLALSTSTLDLVFGSRHSNDGVGYVDEGFSGAIDDVRLYNRVISLAEIKSLYNATK
jgi:prepilin-type N-terminal cleavage/methylation domain-containing protein